MLTPSERIPHPKRADLNDVTFFGQRIDWDCTGTQSVRTPGGATVGCLGVDRWSNTWFPYPVKSKMDSPRKIELTITRRCNSKTEVIRTDQGPEFINYELGGILERLGVRHETSNVGDSPQNGSAERNLGILWEMIRVRLVAGLCAAHLWGEAMNHADVTHDVMPCFANPECKSPYEMRTGKKPDLSRLRMFGELGFVLLPKSEKYSKLLARAIACMLVGYEDPLGTKGYRMYSYEVGKIYVSRDVKFMGRMHNAGPKPDVSMLTIKGIDNFMDSEPADSAIANLALAKSLQGRDQPDNLCADTVYAVLFQLTPDLQASDLFTPRNFKDASTCARASEWLNSMRLEEDGVYDNKVVEEVPINEVPYGEQILTSGWVYKNKSNADGTLKLQKSRICVHGYQGNKGYYPATYSPVAAITTVRLIFSVAALLGLTLRQSDVREAFKNSRMPASVRRYVRPPPGSRCPKGKVWRMLSYLYGYNDAPLEWYKLLAAAMLTLGYKRCVDEPCLFYKITKSVYSISCVIVDDMITASSPPSANDELIKGLKRFFSVKDLGVPRYVLGLHVKVYDPKHFSLSQTLYIQKIKAKYKLGDTSPLTPAVKDHDVSTSLGDPSSATTARVARYRSLLGALMYCSLTRPDICVSLSDLSRISKPTAAHEKLLRRVGNYVVATADLELHYQPTDNQKGRELESFGDASFDTCPDTSRSRTGTLHEFCACAILWKARFQKFVALSSTEAEYAAGSDTAQDIAWLRRVLADIGFPQSGATRLHIDNSAAITLAENNISTRPRTKHIRRRMHFLREQTAEGIIAPTKIVGSANPADFFTKVLGKRLFLKGRARFLR